MHDKRLTALILLINYALYLQLPIDVSVVLQGTTFSSILCRRRSFMSFSFLERRYILLDTLDTLDKLPRKA
jgi:hypothetical protein